MAYEKRVIDGFEFTRPNDRAHWDLGGGPGSQRADEKLPLWVCDPPHVYCDCGCRAFSLRYGTATDPTMYTITARCIDCGREAPVW